MYCIFETHGFPEIKFSTALGILTIQEFDLILCKYGYRLLKDSCVPPFILDTERDGGIYTNDTHTIHAALLPDNWVSIAPEGSWGISLEELTPDFRKFKFCKGEWKGVSTYKTICFDRFNLPTQHLRDMGFDY